MRMIVKGVLVLAVVLFSLQARASDISEVFSNSYTAETKGNYEDAYKLVNDIFNAKLDSNIKYAMKMRLAYLKALMSKHAEAASLYGEAAEIMPRAVEPLAYQEYEYYTLKDWKKLQEICNKALNIDSKHYYSRARLAYACLNLGDYNSSFREYSKVNELYPLDMEIKSMIGWVYAYMKDKTNSSRIFQEVLTVSPLNESAKAGVEYLKKN